MLFLVTGASGVGKSTVRRLLEPEFAGVLEIAELATLGVTSEWSLAWRHRMVERLVQRAVEARSEGKHFLLCGDPVPPGEVYAAPSANQLISPSACSTHPRWPRGSGSAHEATSRSSSRGMWRSPIGCANT